MLAWERQESESARAYEAFSLYRDMGPERSLSKVAQELGKSVSLMARWSAEHSWVDRVDALAARDEMIAREAVERHLFEKAEDRGRREAALLDRALGVREKAMDMAERMVAWPLAQQRVVRQEGPDGEEEVTMIFHPAGWNKSTALGFYRLALDHATQPQGPPGPEYDFDEFSEEELQELIRLSEKMVPKRPEGF